MVDLSQEWTSIRRVALMHGVDPLFVCAIRLQENGDPEGEWGEFGLPTARYGRYDLQLEGCVKTLRTYFNEYLKNPFTIQGTDAGFRRLVYSDAAIAYVARRYAPTGASNDPKHLNENWRRGVAYFYYAFTRRGEDVMSSLERA